MMVKRRKASTALFTFQKAKKARKPFKFKAVSIIGALKPIGKKVRAKREMIEKERRAEAKRTRKREKAFAKFIAGERKRTKIIMPMRRI